MLRELVSATIKLYIIKMKWSFTIHILFIVVFVYYLIHDSDSPAVI